MAPLEALRSGTDSARSVTPLVIRLSAARSPASCRSTQLFEASRMPWCSASKTTCYVSVALAALCRNVAEPAPRRECSAASAARITWSQSWAPGAGYN